MLSFDCEFPEIGQRIIYIGDNIRYKYEHGTVIGATEDGEIMLSLDCGFLFDALLIDLTKE